MDPTPRRTFLQIKKISKYPKSKEPFKHDICIQHRLTSRRIMAFHGFTRNNCPSIAHTTTNNVYGGFTETMSNRHPYPPSGPEAYPKDNMAGKINLDPPEVNEFLLQTIPETTESEIRVLKPEANADDHHPHQVIPDHPPENSP